MNKEITAIVIIGLFFTVCLSGCNEMQDEFELKAPSYSSSCKSLLPMDKNIDGITFVGYQNKFYTAIGAVDGVGGNYEDAEENFFTIEIYKFKDREDVEVASNMLEDIHQTFSDSGWARPRSHYIDFSKERFLFCVIGYYNASYEQVESLAMATGYYP